MPQKQSETPSLSKYVRTVEKRNGERVVYTFPAEPAEAGRMADAVREYAAKNQYVYTEDEKRLMPDESMQVYVLDKDSVVVASRAYTGNIGERARAEAREIAEYAYTLLKDSKLLRA
ncbi:MAG: hypothetical protein BK997_02965 [Candidatus Micrarchaeum sp. ARMAN-1]|nr:MAG: hypothetical protein BK997_02965 [Candidatus Micrarchaeum sp. ARMAN-1]